MIPAVLLLPASPNTSRDSKVIQGRSLYKNLGVCNYTVNTWVIVLRELDVLRNDWQCGCGLQVKVMSFEHANGAGSIVITKYPS
jgi:hypothetical protein